MEASDTKHHSKVRRVFEHAQMTRFDEVLSRTAEPVCSTTGSDISAESIAGSTAVTYLETDTKRRNFESASWSRPWDAAVCQLIETHINQS